MGEAMNPGVDVMQDLQLELLEGEKLCIYWPMIWKQISAVPHTWTHWTEDYIHASCFDGTFQIWAAGTREKIELIIFTQIVYYPIGKVLQCVWAGGNNLEKLLPLLDATITKFAAMNGCKRGEVVGRAGWGKVLREFGFTEQSCVFSKPIYQETIQ
jgi:hypothetical protein